MTHTEVKAAAPARPPIGSTFYLSPDSRQSRKKRSWDEELTTTPAAPHASGMTPEPKARRIGAGPNHSAAPTRPLAAPKPQPSAHVPSDGKNARALAAKADEQRLTQDVKAAIAGVQQATKDVSMPDAMRWGPTSWKPHGKEISIANLLLIRLTWEASIAC